MIRLASLKLYLILGVAIVAEVVATTALARSESFTRAGPSIVAILGYASAFRRDIAEAFQIPQIARNGAS